MITSQMLFCLLLDSVWYLPCYKIKISLLPTWRGEGRGELDVNNPDS